jgi:hypothetical protein
MSLSSPASEKKSVRGIVASSTTNNDEEIVFRHKCRVFAMRDNKWVELGTGDAKLLQHKRTGRTRLTLRKEKTVTYILNHFVQPDAILVPARSEKEADGSRAFVFEAEDFATSEKRKETFAIRFKIEAAATGFQKAYIEAQDRNREIQSLATSAAATTATSSTTTESGSGSSVKVKPAASEDALKQAQLASPLKKAASPAAMKASLSPLPKNVSGPGTANLTGSPSRSSPAKTKVTTPVNLKTPTTASSAIASPSSSRLVSPVAATINIVSAPESDSKITSSTSSASSSSSSLLSSPRVVEQAIQEEDEEAEEEEDENEEGEEEEESDTLDPPKIPEFDEKPSQSSKDGGVSSSTLLVATATVLVLTGVVALAVNPKLLASAIKTRDTFMKQAVTFIESVSKKT